MSRDLNSKWNFQVKPKSVPGEGGEDAAFSYFRYSPIRFIVREYVQNSMDAGIDGSDQPVRIEFSAGCISSDEYPELIGGLLERMKACHQKALENTNSRDVYKKKVEYLENHIHTTIPFLKVSDYNTKGMPYVENENCGFEAGARNMSASFKSTGKAGGSHGLGKAVGFLTSEINAVYFSTMDAETGDCFGEGHVRLCTHKIDGIDYFGAAFYDHNGGDKPDKNDEIPEEFRRTEPGTDVFILGLELCNDELEEMKREVLRSFFKAIYDNKIEVSIAGEVFKQSNLDDQMLLYYSGDENIFDTKRVNKIIEYFNPRPYYTECVNCFSEDENHIYREVTLQDYPNMGHANLWIFKNEDIKSHSEDRIICMRDKEMAIEVYAPRTRKGYYGIFICDGDGSEILRKMENVTHDKWEEKQVKDLDAETVTKSREIIKEKDKFITAVIDELFPQRDDAEYTVPMLDQMIFFGGQRREGDNGSQTQDNSDRKKMSGTPTSTKADSISVSKITSEKIGRLLIKKKGGMKKPSKKRASGGLYPISQPIPGANPGIPPTPPPMPPVPPIPVPPGPTPGPIIPKDPDTGKEGKESETGDRGARKTGKHAADIEARFRVKMIRTEYGPIHRVVINSDDNYESCSAAIDIAGEESDSTLKFSCITPGCHVTGKDGNIITGFSLVPGKNYLDIQFEDNDYHSLVIKAYEN